MSVCWWLGRWCTRFWWCWDPGPYPPPGRPQPRRRREHGWGHAGEGLTSSWCLGRTSCVAALFADGSSVDPQNFLHHCRKSGGRGAYNKSIGHIWDNVKISTYLILKNWKNLFWSCLCSFDDHACLCWIEEVAVGGGGVVSVVGMAVECCFAVEALARLGVVAEGTRKMFVNSHRRSWFRPVVARQRSVLDGQMFGVESVGARVGRSQCWRRHVHAVRLFQSDKILTSGCPYVENHWTIKLWIFFPILMVFTLTTPTWHLDLFWLFQNRQYNSTKAREAGVVFLRFLSYLTQNEYIGSTVELASKILLLFTDASMTDHRYYLRSFLRL